VGGGLTGFEERESSIRRIAAGQSNLSRTKTEGGGESSGKALHFEEEGVYLVEDLVGGRRVTSCYRKILKDVDLKGGKSAPQGRN